MFFKPPKTKLLLLAFLAVTTAPGVAGQQLPAGMTPQQALELARQNPELVRERLQQSGLSSNEIRSRLRSAGYAGNLLDGFLDSAAVDIPDADDSVLAAISALGISGLDTAVTSLEPAGPTNNNLPLALFGQNVFSRQTSQFLPITAGPVDPSYVLGPGDLLVLILSGEVELAYGNLEVNREGFIFIPRIGQVFVNNLTIRQLRDILYTRLGQSFPGITRGSDATTTFDITVARVRMNGVRVIGEVARPGLYQIPASGTLLSALYQANGITSVGNFRDVQLRRGGTLVATFDLYDYLLRGESGSDVRMENGDVVFVPVRGARVTITGQVTRPAVYEVRPGEGLSDLIGAAGGLTAEAFAERLNVSRIIPAAQRTDAGRSRIVESVELGPILSEQAVYPLADGDSIDILTIPERRTQFVSVVGAVWEPGTFGLTPGMRVSDLIRLAGGFQPETYSERAQILRRLNDSSTVMLPVTLPTQTGGAVPNDIELQEFDELRVFGRTEFASTRPITIHGAVRAPGTLVYSNGMTLRDAILLAGGPTDDAYLVTAEVSRITDDNRTQSIAEVFSVALDSSFAVDTTSLARGRSLASGQLSEGDFPLMPYDQVFLRAQPGFERQRNVTITGEVHFPGTYSLQRKDERLTDLIARAGGLTDLSYPNGIRFFRPLDNTGRISVDLPEVIEDPTHRENLILQARDSIHIPEFVPIVRVEGEVHSPTSVTWVPGEGTGYYVRAAGGFTDDADKGDTYVMQPNGIIQDRGRRPEPGATVVIPLKSPGEGLDLGVLFAGVAQILSAVTTMILVVERVTN